MFDKIQAEQKEWEMANFGEVNLEQHVLGAIEEYGEFFESGSIEEAKDAVGDFLIYCCGIMTDIGYKLSDLVIVSKFSYGAGFSPIRKLAHSALKFQQNIRNNEDHIDSILTALRSLLYDMVNDLLTSFDDCYSAITEPDLELILAETWNTVKQRNWKVNDINGEV